MGYEFATSQDDGRKHFANTVIQQLIARGVHTDKLWIDPTASASSTQSAHKKSARIICFVDEDYINDPVLCKQFINAGKKGPGNRIIVAMSHPDTLANMKGKKDGSVVASSIGSNVIDASAGIYSDASKVAEKLMLDAHIKINQTRRMLPPNVEVIDHTGKTLKAAVSGLATPLIQSLVKVHQKPMSKELVTTMYEGLSSQPIGAGGTAQVVMVTHKVSKKKYACKILRIHSLSATQRANLKDEITIMQKLDHPNVVKIIEVFLQADKMFIIMELCHGGDLFDRISSTKSGKFSEAYTKKLVVQMLRSLNYLHQNNIMHRDLKLENFLFTTKDDDADIKLIDFGFSIIHDPNETFHRFIGTPFYMAPEVVMKNYTEAADMWSFGAVIYMMLTGELPICGSSDRQTLQNIYNLTIKPKDFGKIVNRVPGVRVSQNCADFVTALMNVNVKKRLTTTQAFAHPWITTNSELPVNCTPPHDHYNMSDTVGSRILEFAAYPVLKRTCLQVTAHYLEASDIKQLAEQFNSIDADNNGTIEFSEFYNSLAGVLKAKNENSDVLTSFLTIDQDKSFRLQFSEFLAAAVDAQQTLTRDAMFTSFRALDLNHDGIITSEEIMAALGTNFNADDVKKMIAECDLDRNGTIDKREFRAAISGIKLPSPEEYAI
eukprot:m.205158 g.205158  ORF g.205158 m.205158 type:complete len:661 (-) comp32906_c4_seq2:26-2008(-)